MSGYKPAETYSFLEEFSRITNVIKKEVEEVEKKILDISDETVALVTNRSQGSSFYNNKTWNPLFAVVIQGKPWFEFMHEHKFVPTNTEAKGIELICEIDRVRDYYNQHIPNSSQLLIELFRKFSDKITNIYIWRLQGNKGSLPLHANFDPHMYRCHMGVLVPEGDIGMEVDGEETKWEEGKFVIFDSMRPHRVWNNTGKARYIVNIDCYRPEPNQEEVKAVNKLLVAMRMKENKLSYALSGGMPVLGRKE